MLSGARELRGDGVGLEAVGSPLVSGVRDPRGDGVGLEAVGSPLVSGVRDPRGDGVGLEAAEGGVGLAKRRKGERVRD